MIQILRRLRKTQHSTCVHWNSLKTFLTFCERRQHAFTGSVQPYELDFLKELTVLANSMEGPIVEVGTLFGFTTQFIARWKDDTKSLITIDDYSWNPVGMIPSAHRAFTQRNLFYLIEKCHTELFEGLSGAFYAGYQGPPPAMVFIDASHEYEHVLADIRWAQSQGVQIISGHDYDTNWPSVCRAVDECFGGDFRVEGSLWAWIKKQPPCNH